MSLVYVLYLTVPLATVFIILPIAYWIHTRHGDVRGSEWFVAALLCGTAWMSAHLAHLLLRDVGLQLFAATLSVKFAVWSFLAAVVFGLRYSAVDVYRSRVIAPMLGAVFLSTLLPTWREPYRSLVYEEWAARSDPFHYVTYTPNPWYAVVGIVVALLTTYTLAHLIRYMLAMPRRSWTRLVLLVVGSLSIMVAVALGNLGVFPVSELPNAQFGLLPYAVCLSVALFRFRLFDVQPVARNAVVEDLQDPVFVLDRERHLVDYNRAAARIAPSVDESVGTPLATVLPELAEAIDPDAETDDASRLTLTVGGESRHYSVNVSRVGDDRRDGDDTEWRSVLLRDVTELERSRWQLRKQNERLEQVASTVSHDLRNPITVADGHADILESVLADGPPDEGDVEKARQHVGAIRESHDRMLDIIDDVLALARGGKAVEETEPVSLAAVARDAWENVRTDGATLSIEADLALEADRSKLLSVFENLFRNAIEHGSTNPPSQAPEDAVEHGSTGPSSQAHEDSSPGGTESSDPLVVVGPTEDGFYVADDGPGIPASHRDRIFEYGYTTDGDGTGLGLSIVRTIAESHGWTVELDGEAPGTRFVFSTTNERTTEEDGRQ